MQSTSAAPSLTLRRRYAVPRERAFAAWTDPSIVATFFGPGEVTCKDVTMDVRPGGAYRIGMVTPDGEVMYVGGTYREVAAPDRLSMTWRWEEDDPKNEHDTLLTLEFNDVGGETEIVLTHSQLASVESRDKHEHGWGMILDAFASVDLAR
jgi:uncharacterized protein YndB with AHSA1/START domain